METYGIIDLLMFLKVQQNSGYQGIDAIFEIISDKAIPEEQKLEVVISVLRQLGLNEQEVDNEVTVHGNDDLPDGIKRNIVFHSDCFELEIMNATLNILIVSN